VREEGGEGRWERKKQPKYQNKKWKKTRQTIELREAMKLANLSIDI
jgi:hypothetical protein